MLIYYVPDGEFVNNPSSEFIHEIISKEASYWAKGGGDSSLFFEGEDSRNIFFKDESFGFLL